MKTFKREKIEVAPVERPQRLSQVIEKAMSDAVIACTIAGETDPDKIREAMRVARKAAVKASRANGE